MLALSHIGVHVPADRVITSNADQVVGRAVQAMINLAGLDSSVQAYSIVVGDDGICSSRIHAL